MELIFLFYSNSDITENLMTEGLEPLHKYHKHVNQVPNLRKLFSITCECNREYDYRAETNLVMVN